MTPTLRNVLAVAGCFAALGALASSKFHANGGRCESRGAFVFPKRKTHRYAIPDEQCAHAALSRVTGKRIEEDGPEVVDAVLRRMQQGKLPKDEALLTHVAEALHKILKKLGDPDAMSGDQRLERKRRRARQRAKRRR